MNTNWGLKRACRKCAAHFYDLNKTEFDCPKCGANYTAADFVSKNIKASEASLKKENRKKSAAFPLEDALENMDDVIDDDLEDTDLIEDAEELDDEDVDVHTVIKHEEQVD